MAEKKNIREALQLLNEGKSWKTGDRRRKLSEAKSREQSDSGTEDRS